MIAQRMLPYCWLLTNVVNCKVSFLYFQQTIVWVELTKDQRFYYRAIYENRMSDLLKGSQNSNIPNLRNVVGLSFEDNVRVHICVYVDVYLSSLSW